jgi:hypothetical protein
MLFVSIEERRDLSAMAIAKKILRKAINVRNDGRWGRGESEAGILKDYCGTKSGSSTVELRFCPWLI